MILTGKCKEDFGDKCVLDKHEFDKLPESCKNALIIDFLDNNDTVNFQDIYLMVFKNYFLMRPISFIQAEAIKKANQIYNESN